MAGEQKIPSMKEVNQNPQATFEKLIADLDIGDAGKKLNSSGVTQTTGDCPTTKPGGPAKGNSKQNCR